MSPILEKAVDEDDPLRIDEIIVAGRAQANLIKALLRLDDIDDKTRDVLLSDPTWKVPRVTLKVSAGGQAGES